MAEFHFRLSDWVPNLSLFILCLIFISYQSYGEYGWQSQFEFGQVDGVPMSFHDDSVLFIKALTQYKPPKISSSSKSYAALNRSSLIPTFGFFQIRKAFFSWDSDESAMTVYSHVCCEPYAWNERMIKHHFIKMRLSLITIILVVTHPMKPFTCQTTTSFMSHTLCQIRYVAYSIGKGPY